MWKTHQAETMKPMALRRKLLAAPKIETMMLATGVPMKLAMTPMREMSALAVTSWRRRDDLRQRGLPRGNEKAVARAHEEDDGEDGGEAVELEPEVEHREREHHAGEVGIDHDPAAREAVDDPAVERRKQQARAAWRRR